MIYIKVDSSNNVISRHYKPFDDKDGLHKTEQELLQDGILVDSIPEPDTSDTTKIPLLKYDGTKLFYEYIDRQLTQDEINVKELEKLKAQNAQMLFALVQGGLM